ncbi:ion channel TACAN-like [Ylistrum balloti]|uniref:ion channel TACAN-like n=1 Tax=Ylistrum balloti TaxID=509963 RepID=UPI0029059CF9|nr:ion channel TACAN-like [Ylistrum balloti]
MDPSDVTAQTCLDEWNDCEKEYMQLETDHEQYKRKLDEMLALQKKCLTGIANQRKRLKKILGHCKEARIQNLDGEQKAILKELDIKAKNHKTHFREMEECLPHKNGIYLSIILGQVNVSLLNKADKFAYKEDYHHLYITMPQQVYLIYGGRWLDALHNFLLVWYYCTLTIRENILVVNGSRIKGWWVTHHFISTVCAGIALIWPDGYSYQSFRTQHVIFSLYLSMLYVLQYFYQKGSLYRLRALGKGHEMDITVEGFMSWMWKGISFILPFLFAGYCFQLYNSYVLYHLALQSPHWQVFALSFLHGFLGMGNIATTLFVVQQKIKEQVAGLYKSRLPNKYRFNARTKNL